MYDFHKVRNLEGIIEFKHAWITKDNRFKNEPKPKVQVSEIKKLEKIEIENDKSYLLELNRLRKTTKELEETMANVSNQTDKTILLNRDLINKIYESNVRTDYQTRKLLLIYFALLANYEPEIVKNFMASLAHMNQVESPMEEHKNAMERINFFIQNFSKKIILNVDMSGNYLDCMLRFLPSVQNHGVLDLKMNDLMIPRPVHQFGRSVFSGELLKNDIDSFGGSIDDKSIHENHGRDEDINIVKSLDDHLLNAMFDMVSKQSGSNMADNSVFHPDSKSDFSK